MTTINSMTEFKKVLEGLSLEHQRIVAARFVAEVLDLTDDERVKEAQMIAANPDASPDSIRSAYHRAWHAAVESSVHSDMEMLDWQKQTAHFVAKACAESLAPTHPGTTVLYLAINAANHCRMARICANIEHEAEKPSLANAEAMLNQQIQAQFEIVERYLDELK
jgi:hypothetical protein